MGYLGLTAGRAECEGFLCSNPAQPLLGEVTGAVARPGGTGEGRRCWWPLGPRAEVSTREERWSRGDEWAVARQSGLRNAPETGAGGPERVTRGGGPGPEVPQLLPATLWGPLQAPAHPMAAGHSLGTPAGTPHIPWLLALGLPGVGRGPVSGSPRSQDGSGVGLASSPQSRSPLTRQTRLPCLPGSRLQGTRGPPRLRNCRGGTDKPAMLACPTAGRAPPQD